MFFVLIRRVILMGKDVSNQTVVVLVILAIVVSLVGVLTIFAETTVTEGRVDVGEDSATGSISISVREPLVDTSTGSITLEIAEADT